MTADTSAAIAALSAWHENHARAAEALADVTALPAHVVLEAYAVLTRLPGGLAVAAADASRVLADRFPGEPLTIADRTELLPRLAAAGIRGGASYDGLVALEAEAHGEMLLTLDRRAQEIYRRLGVGFQAV